MEAFQKPKIRQKSGFFSTKTPLAANGNDFDPKLGKNMFN